MAITLAQSVNSTGKDGGNQLDLGVLRNLLGFNIRAADVAIQQVMGKTIGTPKISYPQFSVLIVVEANPGVSQVAIGDALEMDRTTTMKFVDILQNQGWLVRKRSKEDRRRYELHLTKEGTAFVNKVRSKVLEKEKKVTAGLTEKEARSLNRLLMKLSVSLRQ